MDMNNTTPIKEPIDPPIVNFDDLDIKQFENVFWILFPIDSRIRNQ